MTFTVEQALDQLPERKLLAGLSGGLDSSVLLHALARHRAAGSVRAIHVHHGLHDQADSWAMHCHTLCTQLGVEMIESRVQVERNAGCGLESAARSARYAAFASTIRPDEDLVLAHHQDDQAETLLLRLLRASGSDGLAEMRVRRAFADGDIWRPLLGVPRAQLQDYARLHGLQWIEDPSNSDLQPDRNFLRLQVVPALKARWPRACAALARSAQLLAEDADLLRGESQRRLDGVVGDVPGVIRVRPLLELAGPWRRRVLRQWLLGLGVPMLPGAAMSVIERDLLAAQRDTHASYDWSGHRLRRWRDAIHLTTVSASPGEWQCPWDGASPLRLPTGDWLWLEPAEPNRAALTGTGLRLGPLQVRARRGGERLTLPGRSHSSALKKLLQQGDLPPWQRERVPLLFDAADQLLAAGDLLQSAALQAHLAEQALVLRWGPFPPDRRD